MPPNAGIVALDRVYDSSLEYFRALENYIAAGEEKLRRLDSAEIPEAPWVVMPLFVGVAGMVVVWVIRRRPVL